MLKCKIAENTIRDVLQERGINYSCVCKKLGISEADFNKCMNGTKNLKASEFISLCIFLNLKIKDFRYET